MATRIRSRWRRKTTELKNRRPKIVAALQSAQHEDFVDASIRHFCKRQRAPQVCADFDAKRRFLADHVERVGIVLGAYSAAR